MVFGKKNWNFLQTLRGGIIICVVEYIFKVLIYVICNTGSREGEFHIWIFEKLL